MMNGNSNQIYPSFKCDNNKLSVHHLSHRAENDSNTGKQFVPRSTSNEKYNSNNMPFTEKENVTPQR